MKKFKNKKLKNKIFIWFNKYINNYVDLLKIMLKKDGIYAEVRIMHVWNKMIIKL